MNDNDSTKFVSFEKYCNTCKYQKTPATHDPCNDCLAVGAREGTEVPENWKEKENGD